MKLPFELELGQIKSLEVFPSIYYFQIRIPWFNLGSQPVEIFIEGLHMIIAMQSKEKWQQENIFDQKKLEQNLTKLMEEISQDLASKQDISQGFIQRLKTKVFDNIQIKIRGVHVRFEDKFSGLRSYSFGIGMKNLEIVNTNENWEPQFIDRSKQPTLSLFKILKIEGLGLYLNPNDQLIIHQFTQDQKQRIEIMDSILKFEEEPLNEAIQTISTMKTGSINYFLTPNVLADYQKFQLSQSKTKKFKFLRPLHSKVTRDNASLWWKFAIDCVLRSNRARKGSIVEFTISSPTQKSYKANFLKLFEKFYTNQRTDKWKPEDKLMFRHILLSFDLDQIRPWIKTYLEALEQTKKSKFLSAQSSNRVVSWFFSKSTRKQSSSSNDEDEKQQQMDEQEVEMIKKELEELENSIQQSYELQIVDIKDSKMKVNFKIQTISMEIGQSTDFNVVEGISLFFLGSTLSYQSAEQQMKIQGAIGDIGLDLFKYDQEKQQRLDSQSVIVGKGKQQEFKQSQLSFRISKNDPDYKNIDNLFQLKLNQLTFIYSKEFLKRIYELSHIKITDNIEAVIDTYDEMREATSAQIQQILYRKTNRLEIDIGSPVIVLPLSEQASDTIPIFVFRLGDFQIQTLESTKEYESYQLFIKSIGMQYYHSQQIWMAEFEERFSLVQDKEVRSQNLDKVFRIVEDISLNFVYKVKTKKGGELILSEQQKQQYRQMAKTHIQGQSSDIKLNMTHFIYNKMVNMGEMFQVEANSKENLMKENLKIKQEAVAEAQKIGSLKKRIDPLKKWEKFFCILNGSYLYFYSSYEQSVHTTYYNINGAKIIVNDPTIEIKYTLVLQNKHGECVLSFNSEPNLTQWKERIANNIYELQQNQGVKMEESFIQPQKKPIKHFDSIKSYFSFNFNQIQVKLFKEKDILTEWVTLSIDQFSMWKQSKAIDAEMNLSLNNIVLFDHSLEVYNTLLSKQITDKNILELKQITSTSESPNFQGINSLTKAKMAGLKVAFHPNALNEVLKFFRYTKPIKEDDEDILNQKYIEKQVVEQETCEHIPEKFMQFDMEIDGIEINMHHHIYLMKLFRMKSNNLKVSYITHFDHYTFSTELQNLRFYDLTNWPYTVDPKTFLQNRSSIKQKKKKIIMIQPEEGQQEAGLRMVFESYQTKFCKLRKAGFHSKMELSIKPLKMYYYQEVVMRINSYFFEKFLYGLLNTDPYHDAQYEFNKMRERKTITKQTFIEMTNLQQSTEIIEMNLVIGKTEFIIKDRPQRQEYFGLTLEELKITQSLQKKIGRIESDKYKEILCVVMDFSFKQFQFNFCGEQMLSNPFKMSMQLEKLQFSPLFEKLDPHLIDQGMRINMVFDPFELKLPQNIYTFILQMLDLNINHTDFLQKEFYFVNFYNIEEYVKSLHGVVFMKLDLLFLKLSVSLFHIDGSFISELQLHEMTYHMTKYLDNQNFQTIKSREFFILEEPYDKDGFLQREAVIGPLNSPQIIQVTRQQQQTLLHGTRNIKNYQLEIRIENEPGGDKKNFITIQGLRIYIKPHILLMIYYFFLNSHPVYDKNSVDKPYYYTEDPEEAARMLLQVVIKRSVLVFQNRPGLKKTILCEGDIHFDLVRENVKKLKAGLNWDDGQKTKIWEMGVKVQDFRPFIAFTSQLNTEREFDMIKKTQLFTPFDFHYTSTLDMKKDEFGKFGVISTNDLKLNKMKVKISMKDMHLMFQIISFASENIAKEYTEKLKKIDNFIKEKKEKEIVVNQKEDSEFDIRKTLEKDFSIILRKSMNCNRPKSNQLQLLDQIGELEMDFSQQDFSMDSDSESSFNQQEIQDNIKLKYDQKMMDQFMRLSSTAKALRQIADKYNRLSQVKESIYEARKASIISESSRKSKMIESEEYKSKHDIFENSLASIKAEDINIEEIRDSIEKEVPAMQNIIMNVLDISVYGIKIVISSYQKVQLFINDFDQVFCPVLDISIPYVNMTKDSNADAGQDIIDVQGVKILYYNGYLSDWEPFLENFDLNYRAEREKDFYSMSVELPTAVNFNITERCVQNLVDTYNTWMQSPSFDTDDARIASEANQEKRQIMDEEDDQFQNLTLCSIMNLTNSGFEVQRLSNVKNDQKPTEALIESIESDSMDNESDQSELARNTLRDYKLQPGEEVEYAIRDIQEQEEEIKNIQHRFTNKPGEIEEEKQCFSPFSPQSPKVLKTSQRIYKRKIQELINIKFDNYLSFENIDLNLVQQRCIQLVKKTSGSQAKIDYRFDKNVYLEGFDEGTYKYKKRSKLLDPKNSKTQYLLIGITMKKMRKIFTIRTPYGFYNNTINTMGIVITNRINGEVAQKIILSPQQRFPLFFSHYDDHDFKVFIPRDDEKEYYSKNQAIENMLALKFKEGIMLQHDKNMLTWIQKNKNELRGAYDFVLMPPLIIKNGFPCPISILFGQDQELNHSIEKGQKRHEHNKIIYNPLNEEFVFHFQVEGYDITELRLKKQEYNVVDQNLKIYSEGHSTNICARIQSENAIIQIIFYAYTCIYNHSDNYLQFTYANIQKTPLTGQSQDRKYLFANKEDPIYAKFQFNHSKILNIKNAGLQDHFSLNCSRLLPDGERNNGDYRAQEEARQYEFSYSTYLSLALENEFVYTKMVEIMPRFVLVNNMRSSILVSQNGVQNRTYIVLKKGQREEWAWLDPETENKMLVIKKKNLGRDIENESAAEYQSEASFVRDKNWKWSRSFDISEVGILSIQLRKNGLSTKTRNTIKIVKIIKNDEDLQAPTYKVVNDTSNMAVRFVQDGVSYEEFSQKVLPKSETPYAFNDPKLPQVIVCHFLFEKRELEDLDMSEELIQEATYKLFKQKFRFDIMDSDIPAIQYSTSEGINVQIHVKVYTDGYTRIVKFSQSQVDQNKDNFKVNEESEEVKNIRKLVREMKVIVREVNISLICPIYLNKELRKEIALLSLENIELESNQKEGKDEISLKVMNIQIDNQGKINALYPTILQAMRYKQTRFNKSKYKPLIDMKMVRNVLRPDVTFIEDLDVNIQGIVVKCDDEFIGYTVGFAFTLLGILKTNLTGIHPLYSNKVEEVDPIAIWKAVEVRDQEDRIYIKNAKLNELIIEVSFLARKNFQMGQQEEGIYLMKIMNSSGLAIINIDEAPITLQSFQKRELFGFYQDFIKIITDHYKNGIQSNLIKLVGSTEILGNPTKLVKTIGKGFSEVYNGQGITGKLKGSGILFKSSFEGILGYIGSLTSSISKGFLLLSFDEEYLQGREEKLITQKAQNLVEGVGFGCQSMINGIYGGVSGVFVRPIEEGIKNGFTGVLKGTASGITGLAFKPISGTIDLFVKSTEGVKYTLKTFDPMMIFERHRLPRPFYGASKQIKSYDEGDAYIVGRLLENLKEGLFKNDRFVEAIRVDGTVGVVILIVTCEHFISVEAAQKSVWWYIKTENIVNAVQMENGILFKTKNKLVEENVALEIEEGGDIRKVYKRVKELIHKSQDEP